MYSLQYTKQKLFFEPQKKYKDLQNKTEETQISIFIYKRYAK